MSVLPVSLIYTQDAVLLQRIGGYLYERADLQEVTDSARLELLLHQNSSTLLFMDLRAPDCVQLLTRILNEFPGVVVIALGAQRSDPGLRAAAAGVYAVEPADVDRLRLQTLFGQVQSHLRLQQENRILKEGLNRIPPPEAPREKRTPELHHFSSAFRRFDNVGIMLESIVEGVASCSRVSRVGIFTITSADVFAYRAGVKCMEETRALEFEKTDPFVQWLQIHAYSISRSMLRYIESVEERVLIEQMLDRMGAEAILPLFGRERLNGWLCLGRSASGAPFGQGDIEELTQLAEQVSVAIENSLLHESLALEKALAENLLEAIPVGIIATGLSGTVRWFNEGAETLLNVDAADIIDRPVDRLSTFIASQLNRCIRSDNQIEPVAWIEPATRRELSVQTCCLRQEGQCVGAMAVLNDLTEERILREKQNNLERATFWNELAAAISHEVRNPLVAISTFSQLLPERYADEEFRTQFRDITTAEVTRLNRMIDQLDEYASPPTLQFTAVDAAVLLDKAVCKARQSDETSQGAIHIDLQSDLPAIWGDIDALTDSLARLLVNSFAAVAETPQPVITVKASRGEIGIARLAVIIEVCDNGEGIPEEISEKVFSPFCTTKPRGVGLGLPIVRRTMIDHGGLIAIDSQPGSTVVRLSLPVASAGKGGAGA